MSFNPPLSKERDCTVDAPYVARQSSSMMMIDGETMKRADGRYPEQLRHMTITPGILSKAAGSCFLTIGDLKLLVSLTPPRPSLRSKAFKERGSVECKFKCLGSDNNNTQFSKILADTLSAAVKLDSFPNSYIVLDYLVLDCSEKELNENKYVLLAAAAIGGGVALSHAGIEMIGCVSALSFALIDSSYLLVDPTALECSGLMGMLAIVIGSNSSEEILQFICSGQCEDGQMLGEVGRQISEGCKAVFQSVIKPSLLSIN